MTKPPPAEMRWALRAAGAVGVAVALGGALSWKSLRGHLRDPPASEAPPPAPAELARTARDLELPTSARGESRPSPHATIVVTKGQLSVGGDPVPIAVFPEGLNALAARGLPQRYKRRGPNDFLISELSTSLEFRRDQARARALDAGTDQGDFRVAILADRSMPYRVLLELLFTARQAEYGRFELGVRAASGALGWITSTPPKVGVMGTRGLVSGALALSAWIGDEGVTLRVSRGNIATGCQKLGSGVTAPKTSEGYDNKALADCAVRLKHLRPAVARETQLTIVASPGIAYGTVVDVLNALGKNGDEPLFPDTVLAVEQTESIWMSPDPEGIDPWAAEAPADTAPRSRTNVTGAVTIGGAALSGGRVANVEAVVAGMAAGFRRCYAKGLQEDPSMKGSIRLTAKLTSSGDVLEVRPSASSLSGTVVSCAVARVASAQFPPPEGGSATLVIPVTFAPR